MGCALQEAQGLVEQGKFKFHSVVLCYNQPLMSSANCLLVTPGLLSFVEWDGTKGNKNTAPSEAVQQRLLNSAPSVAFEAAYRGACFS